MTYKIGWFSTGRDEAARELLTSVYNAINEGKIDSEIIFVFSNREWGESEESDKFFSLVDEYKIPLIQLSSKSFKPEMRRQGRENSEAMNKWRTLYHREVMKMLKEFNPDLNVLAGYMLITSKEMCEMLDMINLHPAMPAGPKGTWQEVIWELLRTKAEKTGVMMHLVTEILDEGPPITYCTFPIRGGHFDELWKDLDEKLKVRTMEEIIMEEGEENKLFKEIRRQGVMREIPLIVYTIREFASGNIALEGKRVIVGGRAIEGGYDLTELIEEHLKVK